MKASFSNLRINGHRLKQDMEAMALIGSTGDGGVHRPALSHAHLAAREWFRERIEEAGLEFRMDGAGNHSAVLACESMDAPSLLLGSHLDSVPNGGRFDGALGVLAALEVLRTVKEAGLALPIHLEAIDFTDEEGTLVGLLGSRALTGKLSEDDLQNPRGGREELLAGLARAGLTEQGLLESARKPETLAGYIELHIEQDSRLLNSGGDIGIVTNIVGVGSYRLTFIGRADHAGTTPLPERQDAGLGAAAFALAVHHMLQDQFNNCAANLGAIRMEPGAFNIVPALAHVDLEYRAPYQSTFERLENTLLAQAQKEAARYNLKVKTEYLGAHDPTLLNHAVQQATAWAAENLGLRHISLVSKACHDAQSMAEFCPAGMIFVPSEKGASHSPREYTSWQDCESGANTLLLSTLKLASSV